MIFFPKRLAFPAILALGLAAVAFHAQAAPGDGTNVTFPDPTVASGKGFEIKRSQVDDAYLNYSASIAARGGAVREADRADIRSNLLEHLVINKLLLQRANADDRTEAQTLVDKEFAGARSNAPSQQAFDAQIKATGMTLDQLRTQAVDEQTCQHVVVRENTNSIKIEDADINKFYDDNPSKFEMPEQVRAAHILISTQDPATHQPLPPDLKKEKEKLANDLRARAMKGEDFGALAKQYSDDPGSKDKGGEYTFPRGRMVPEFEAAAFSLQTNQISALVETQYGYHIIKLLEKMPASKKTLDETAPRIREYLTSVQVKKQVPAYLAKLKADADVKYADDGGAKAPDDKK